jgi:integrase
MCDKNPARLHLRLAVAEGPKPHRLFAVADEWERDYRQTVTERTWRNMSPHKADIVAEYGDKQIETVTAQDINRDLLAAKARGLSRTVVNMRKVIWSGILNYAVASGYAPFNPALSVKLPKGLPHSKRSAPTEDMVQYIVDHRKDMQVGFIPFFLLCTGCRRNEALTRKKTDLDMEAWELTIPKSKTEAGVRVVPIIEPLREWLYVWVKMHPGPWLFPRIPHRSDGSRKIDGPMSDSNWRTYWGQYCAAAGWVDADGKPEIGAHNLRHGTATLLFEAGVDAYTAQAILGHSQVSTTMQIYTELRQKQRDKSVSMFSASMAELMAGKPKTAKNKGFKQT